MSLVAASVTDADLAVVTRQLGRRPRGVRAIAHRCPCGLPDVVETAPRLDDGSPFPTTFYLTCPRASSAIGTLESTGVMREMSERLADDPELAARYQAAHEDYLARRDAVERLPRRDSAGGMPERVKCLHALAAHALAAGSGVNPLGDETLALVGAWWKAGRCVATSPDDERSRAASDRPGTACGAAASDRPETWSADGTDRR